jgi:arginine decarboxylase
MRMRDEPNPRGAQARGTSSPPHDPGLETSPYLDALADYADREPGRYHVPGHKGGPGADPRLVEAIGERALRMDIPALTYGIDAGAAPTPFQRAQELAAEAWGARRTWFLINGATQGNHAACLALAHRRGQVIVQRNVHSSTVDGLILSGLRPQFVAPELDAELGIAHCLAPESLERALAETPDACGVLAVSPTYFGAVADVATLSRIAHDHEVPLVVDEAWGAHLRFHESLPQDALSAGADLVISSTHKMLGSLTQSAMLHLGGDPGGLDEQVIDRAVTVVESTSPSALLSGSLDATRRWAALHGRDLLDETLGALAELRAAVNDLPGLTVLDEGLQGRPGVYAWDPVRLAIDVRGTGTTGFELARMARELDDINLELAGESVLVAVFGMGEKATAQGRRLVAALARLLERLEPAGDRRARPFAPPPPWGPLELTPREAFLGAQEAVPVEAAAGRIAAESLAAYPPGIPNVLPGERLTAETLRYIQETLRHGGALRGAADRTLRTARVAVEARPAGAARGEGGRGEAR